VIYTVETTHMIQIKALEGLFNTAQG